MGIAGFVIGLIGIFFLSFILSPLALIFGIIAIFKKETVWGIFAIIPNIKARGLRIKLRKNIPINPITKPAIPITDF